MFVELSSLLRSGLFGEPCMHFYGQAANNLMNHALDPRQLTCCVSKLSHSQPLVSADQTNAARISIGCGLHKMTAT